MSASAYIAVDLGAESGRVILGTLQNQKIFIEELHRFPNLPIKKNGNLYWNIPFLFEEIKKGFAIAAKGHNKISSIGIDTWGVDFGMIGKNNQLLELPHTYRDKRTINIPEKVFEKISASEIYERTGIQLMHINSLYQLYSVKLTDESMIKECEKLLFMPDLFNFLLTGEKKSEYTISSTSQLLNSKFKEFDKRIFSSLDLPIDIMAPIIHPGYVIGKLRLEIENETGLKDAEVIAVGSHDTASAVIAIPLNTNDSAYLSSGTWSLLGMELDEPLIDPELQDSFTNEGGVNNKINFLHNTSGLWLIHELKKSWEKAGENFSYKEITNMARECESDVPVIDPDDKLFISPLDMVDAINEYCIKTNQKVPETKGEYSCSIFKSLALKYKTVLEKIEEVSKRKINNLHIVGGGSQNELLNQLTADSTGKQVISGPVEATALGNILVQAIAKGKIESIEKARELVVSSFPQKIYSPAKERTRQTIPLNRI